MTYEYSLSYDVQNKWTVASITGEDGSSLDDIVIRDIDTLTRETVDSVVSQGIADQLAARKAEADKRAEEARAVASAQAAIASIGSGSVEVSAQ